jgi:hypothetical protein
MTESFLEILVDSDFDIIARLARRNHTRLCGRIDERICVEPKLFRLCLSHTETLLNITL